MDDKRPGEANQRYLAISLILSRLGAGESLSNAIAEAKSTMEQSEEKAPSRSALYRWFRAYEKHGWQGVSRKPQVRARTALRSDFCQFMIAEKEKDPKASIPEIIRRAKALGIVPDGQKINRSTAYRYARHANLPLLRSKREGNTKRPFAYPHRMQMVLCDGKHFRAGPKLVKRVAFFFLDDATRYVLDVIVGPSETAELFLRGLHDVIARHGLPGAIYLDKGPAFIADVGSLVARQLNIPFIFGRSRYPEGHGKVERFNRTCLAQCLRGLRGPETDPCFTALRTRIRHYLSEYNGRLHSGIHTTPENKFNKDPRALRLPESMADLNRAFVIKETRKVRNDNAIPFNNAIYEVPFGYAGTRISVFYNTTSGALSMLHGGKVIELRTVDLHANARDRRARRKEESSTQGPIRTATEISFQNKTRPIINSDGGYIEPPDQET